MSESPDRLKAALANRYTVEGELARGGMAIVYLAQDLRHERLVAIKVLRSELTSAVAAERFLREIKVAAGLTHPHILPLLDSGEADGLLYYVMPYVEGESLRERLNRERQLPVGEAVRIAREVADALSYAHAHRLLHRDVKPENILLEAGHAVVADFGIAKALSDAAGNTLTDTGVSIGTPAYMSPEQAAGDSQIDERSDIYSLACVLYEMLGGKPPHTGASPREILAQKLLGDVHPLLELRPDAGAATEVALKRALAAAPEGRFSTAEEFAQSLEAPSFDWYIPWPTKAIAAVVLVCVIGITGWFTLQQILARRAMDRGLPPLVPRQITFTGNAYWPAISPDGQTVAFVSDSGGEMRLMVQATDGGSEPLELYSSQVIGRTEWSRDGSEVLFWHRQTRPDGSLQAYGVVAIPRLGGEPRLVSYGALVTESPDRSRIAFGWTPGDSVIVIRHASGSDSSTVPVPGDSIYPWGIEWSPASDVIAVAARKPRHGQSYWYSVWTVTSDGSQQHRVVEDTVPIALSWSPRGDAIYYTRRGQLWRVDVDSSTGEPSGPNVFTGIDGVRARFSIAADTERMVYVKVAGGSNIWTFDVRGEEEDPGPARRLTHGTATRGDPRMSPDGMTVAFCDEATNSIVAVPLQGGRARVIVKSPSSCDLAWSPDGKSIAFRPQNEETSTISVVAAAGGSPRRLPATEVSAHGLTWCDGAGIVYTASEDDGLYVLDPVTESRRRLGTFFRAFWPRCSPDGRFVAVYRAMGPGLWIISLNDGTTKFLFGGPEIIPIGWSADGRWVYARANGSREVVKVEVGSAKVDTVVAVPFDAMTISMDCMDFDGKQLVVNVADRLVDIWLLENFDRAVR
jgi:serine/threonine-protein kinase